MDCYIYYRSREEHAQEVLEGVRQLKNFLAPELRQSVKLQRRPLAKDGLITWMEIYCKVPENFDMIISAAVAQTDLKSWIVGERFLEYFLPQF